MNLTTRYTGLTLKNPIVASASPLSQSIDTMRRLEDHGASAVIMFSLFEEQYLDVLSRVKTAVAIPVAVKVGPYFTSFAHMAGSASSWSWTSNGSGWASNRTELVKDRLVRDRVIDREGSGYQKLKGADTLELARTLQTHGIRVHGSTIIGLEHHTPENIDAAIDHCSTRPCPGRRSTGRSRRRAGSSRASTSQTFTASSSSSSGILRSRARTPRRFSTGRSSAISR